jgi:hypothetical protein
METSTIPPQFRENGEEKHKQSGDIGMECVGKWRCQLEGQSLAPFYVTRGPGQPKPVGETVGDFDVVTGLLMTDAHPER